MLLFVYGTLKRGFRNAHYLQAAQFVCASATESAGFSMVDIASQQAPGQTYPAVFEGGGYKIAGEIYDIDDETLKAIDVLEQVDIRYRRKTVAFESGHEAFMYIDMHDNKPPVFENSPNIEIRDNTIYWAGGVQPGGAPAF